MLPNTRSQRRAVLSERFGTLYQGLPSEVKAIVHWHIRDTGSRSTLFALIQTCKSLYEEFLPSLYKEVVLNKLNASAFYHGLIDESPVDDRLYDTLEEYCDTPSGPERMVGTRRKIRSLYLFRPVDRGLMQHQEAVIAICRNKGPVRFLKSPMERKLVALSRVQSLTISDADILLRTKEAQEAVLGWYTYPEHPDTVQVSPYALFRQCQSAVLERSFLDMVASYPSRWNSVLQQFFAGPIPGVPTSTSLCYRFPTHRGEITPLLNVINIIEVASVVAVLFDEPPRQNVSIHNISLRHCPAIFRTDNLHIFPPKERSPNHKRDITPLLSQYATQMSHEKDALETDEESVAEMDMEDLTSGYVNCDVLTSHASIADDCHIVYNRSSQSPWGIWSDWGDDFKLPANVPSQFGIPFQVVVHNSLSTNLNDIDWGQVYWDGKEESKVDWDNRVTFLPPASPSPCPCCGKRK